MVNPFVIPHGCDIRFGPRINALLAALIADTPATAGELYQCVEVNGKMAHTDTACKVIGNAGKERDIAYPEAPPSSARRTARAPPVDAPMEHPVMKVEAMIRKHIHVDRRSVMSYIRDEPGTMICNRPHATNCNAIGPQKSASASVLRCRPSPANEE